MDLLAAAQRLYPSIKFNLRGDSIEISEGCDYTGPIPAIEELIIEANKVEYRELRAVAYPPIGDQLDALWKGGQAAIDMLVQIQAVKTKYPKPE